MSAPPAEAKLDGIVDPFFKDHRSGLEKLIGGQAVPHRVFEFEGCGARFKDLGATRWAVRALSPEDKLKAVAAGWEWLTTPAPKGGGWAPEMLAGELGSAAWDLESKVQILARVLVEPAAPEVPLCGADTAKAAESVRRLFEGDEVVALYESWLDFDAERSPLSKLSKWEEVEPLITAVGKGYAAPMALQRCDSASLRFIVRELATRWTSQMRPPSSATSSPSDTSTS